MVKPTPRTSGKGVAHKGRQVLIDKKLRIDWIRSKVAILDDEHLKLVEGIIRRFLKE
jgi:hypothetical protein